MKRRYRAYYDATSDFFAENEDEANEIANKRIPRRCGYADLKELKQCEAGECTRWVVQETDDVGTIYNRFCSDHYKDQPERGSEQ